MKNYKKNLKILEDGHVYSKEMEHDSCGVGLIASTEGKKSRKVVEYGINALKAVWHAGQEYRRAVVRHRHTKAALGRSGVKTIRRQ